MATFENTKASTCTNSIDGNIDGNMCSYTIKDTCNDWNNARIYNGPYSTCDYGMIGYNIKKSDGLYLCNKYNLLSQVDNYDTIKTTCNGKPTSSWDFCTPLTLPPTPSTEPFDPKIQQATEYNTLQNNRIVYQDKYLENVQKEIASKDSVIDIYYNTNKKYCNIYILTVCTCTSRVLVFSLSLITHLIIQLHKVYCLLDL